MASTPVQLIQVDEVLSQQLGSFTKLAKVTAPFTTVVGRAQVTDFSKDLAPKFGINRIMTQAIQEVQGESGPNGERVFKIVNDVHDQVRFVGGWGSAIDTAGAYANAGTQGDYFEVTFYGTGLNLLFGSLGSSGNYTAATDGGAAGANFMTFAATRSSILDARNYAGCQIVTAVSGLALGMHTVKITRAAGGGGFCNFFGFEVLTISSTMQLPPGSSYIGGRKLSKSALSTDAYNSNFELGTSLGTKGGHVVVYQKSDGSIGKTVQPTDVSALLYPSVSHTNESLIRSYSPREFGAGRADDFSTLVGTPSARAFALDDGSTTLLGNSGVYFTSSFTSVDSLTANGAADFIVITFVGTGLDLLLASDGALRPFTMQVDAGTAIAGPSTFTGNIVVKVASGLPYGTHVVRLVNTTASTASTPGVVRINVYGPSKPAIPSGAVEIADYYVLATFSPNATSGLDTVATGVLRKFNTREFIYSGTVSALGLSVTDTIGGFSLSSSATSAKFSYTFFGTGFELRFRSAGLATNTITVDGSANVSGFTTSGYGGASITNTTTGAITFAGGNVGAGIRLSGLTLGLHTMDVTQGAGGQWLIEAIDIIAPIHSPKSDIPGDIQNTLSIGSCSIGDSRKFSPQSVKTLANWSQTFGITSGPTTTSSAPVPVMDMTCVIKTSGNPIEIAYSLNSGTVSGTAVIKFQVYVNGSPVGAIKNLSVAAGNAGQDIPISDNLIVPVSAGVHIVQLFWQTSSNTAGTNSVWRNLKVREIN